MNTLVKGLWLRHIECFECHVIFGMTQEHDDRCREHGDTFYCPNGHSQVYCTSEVTKLKKELKQAKSNASDNYNWALREREDKELARRSAAARLGVITKWRNRIRKGECPVCGTQFKNVRRHMYRLHSDWMKEHPTI